MNEKERTESRDEGGEEMQRIEHLIFWFLTEDPRKTTVIGSVKLWGIFITASLSLTLKIPVDSPIMKLWFDFTFCGCTWAASTTVASVRKQGKGEREMLFFLTTIKNRIISFYKNGLLRFSLDIWLCWQVDGGDEDAKKWDWKFSNDFHIVWSFFYVTNEAITSERKTIKTGVVARHHPIDTFMLVAVQQRILMTWAKQSSSVKFLNFKFPISPRFCLLQSAISNVENLCSSPLRQLLSHRCHLAPLQACFEALLEDSRYLTKSSNFYYSISRGPSRKSRKRERTEQKKVKYFLHKFQICCIAFSEMLQREEAHDAAEKRNHIRKIWTAERRERQAKN